MQQYKNVIIYLIAYPGTGKYTIAKEICNIAPDFRLVDNHLINNPILSIIDADGVTPLPKEVWRNIDLIWDAVLDTMVRISPNDFSFILTNALFNTVSDVAWFAEILAMAERRQSLFVPVLLKIGLEEHQNRIISPDRNERFKEINPLSPIRYKQNNNLIDINHPHLLEVDVTNMSASTAAYFILNAVNGFKKEGLLK